MLFNFVADIAKLSLFIVCAYALLGAYARRRRPQWTEHLTKRRLAVLGALTTGIAVLCSLPVSQALADETCNSPYTSRLIKGHE